MPDVLVISAYLPDTATEYVRENGVTITSQVGNSYLLDVKGSDSRVSSRINMLLGDEHQPLTDELIETLLHCFSKRHVGRRTQFEEFLEQYGGGVIYSHYGKVEYGPAEESGQKADVVPFERP